MFTIIIGSIRPGTFLPPMVAVPARMVRYTLISALDVAQVVQTSIPRRPSSQVKAGRVLVVFLVPGPVSTLATQFLIFYFSYSRV